MTPDPPTSRGDAEQGNELGRQTVRVSSQELLDAFEFADVGGPGDNEAFVCRQTGLILWRSDYLDEADELPEDVEDDAKYLAVPDRWELGLGKPLPLAFGREFLPDDFDDVRHMFSRQGRLLEFQGLAGEAERSRSLVRI